MKFNAFKSNPAKISADAIAVPANERLRPMPGISASVFKAAGKKLQTACDEIGYCAVGSAVPTLAYKLNANYLIHTVVPKWIDGEHGEYGLLASAYLSALHIADLLGCESLAVPLLVSEKNGFDKERAIAVAEKCILDFYGKNLKKIGLIIRAAYTDKTETSTGLLLWTFIKENGKTRRLIDRKDSTKIVVVGVKEFAEQIARDQVNKAAAWFKDKDNQKKLIASGILIAAALMKDKKKEK
jgi:O-acetyl-ADP-ribose deacetylase (regulator of RNase III)